MREYRYRAFISYSHKDRRWAKWLHRSLETYRTPRHLIETRAADVSIPARLTPVFRDRDELASSPDLSDRITEALDNSQNLIVICSPRAAGSRWVNQEIEAFKRLGRSDRIFCLIVDGDPSPSAGEDCFPPALRERYDADGERVDGSAEPVAADARKHADGRSLARLKIIAGLLDVGLDDLRRRELQRKQRRMALITIASLAALAFTIVLALDASFARDEANQRRGQAEELLSFMVGDLRDSLEPIGRLDLLEKVGVSAMRYYSTVDIEDLSDQELLHHAQVLTQLGEIRVSQQEYGEALASFLEAYERNALLHRNDESQGDRLFDRGQAEFWVGYVHWRKGDLGDARDWLTRYLVTAQDLSALDPSRDEWTIEIAYGYHNLAVLAVEAADLAAARDGFERELEILYQLQRRTDSASVQRDIADAMSWLGEIASMRGELLAALEYYERSASNLKQLSAAEADDRLRQYSWAHGELKIANAALMLGQLERAETHIENANLVFEQLVAHDPGNIEWLLSRSNSKIQKGYIHAARGEWEDARHQATSSIAMLDELVIAGTADLSIRSRLIDAHRLNAWTEETAGNISAAIASNQAALDGLQWIEQANRFNEKRIGLLASVFVVRAQLLALADKATAAKEAVVQAAELLSERVDKTGSPLLLDPWVRVLILTGRAGEATELRNVLDSRQYKPLRPWPD